MKTPTALLLSLGVVCAVAVAQTTTTPPATTAPQPAPAPARKNVVQITEPAPAPTTKDPKKDAAKDPKKDAKKKEEEKMGKVDGIEVARPGGKFLGVRIVDGVFRITFYNDKRKPVPPDVARAALRWDAKYKQGMERTVLNPGGDANSLTSGFVVRPPYNFKLFITLLKEGSPDGDNAGETYAIDFRQ